MCGWVDLRPKYPAAQLTLHRETVANKLLYYKFIEIQIICWLIGSLCCLRRNDCPPGVATTHNKYTCIVKDMRKLVWPHVPIHKLEQRVLPWFYKMLADFYFSLKALFCHFWSTYKLTDVTIYGTGWPILMVPM